MSALEARQVHVRFGDRVVLEEMNFSVAPGELHGIMGPNGAGKTTFFNVLTGRVRPSRGHVLVDGKDVTGLPPHRIAALGVARSFQIMTLFDEFSALENVALARPAFRAQALHGHRAAIGDPEADAAARLVLDEVGLGSKAHVLARDLSYGERRALEIAVALAQEPRVLCLDEPTSGLGSDGIARIAEMVRRLKGRLAIVAIEHDMEFLFGLADRISVVHWGQVIAHGRPDELKANPWVRRSNLGRFG
ncbi:ABC transporter ATP-binding protein [Geminicoccus harenae]|uniref:ABC transporter ATP-binding protein n=3 Tax=Geminicoccus harenae TaxID=2498453 RepID=UPI001C94CF37|nr:ABC transporter ATP-binding protein [Geminicoccus harenae]